MNGLRPAAALAALCVLSPASGSADLDTPCHPERYRQSPLTCTRLEDLCTVASRTDLRGARAWIENSEGDGGIVRPGDRVGPNSGRVEEIGPEGVVVLEIYVGFDGRRASRRAVVTPCGAASD